MHFTITFLLFYYLFSFMYRVECIFSIIRFPDHNIIHMVLKQLARAGLSMSATLLFIAY